MNIISFCVSFCHIGAQIEQAGIMKAVIKTESGYDHMIYMKNQIYNIQHNKKYKK